MLRGYLSLECGVLHMVQLMLLSPRSCFIEIENDLAFHCWLNLLAPEKSSVIV